MVLYSQYHGGTRSQDMSSHGSGVVCQEYSRFSTKRVKIAFVYVVCPSIILVRCIFVTFHQSSSIVAAGTVYCCCCNLAQVWCGLVCVQRKYRCTHRSNVSSMEYLHSFQRTQNKDNDRTCKHSWDKPQSHLIGSRCYYRYWCLMVLEGFCDMVCPLQWHHRASHLTFNLTVCSKDCSGKQQRNPQSPTLLALCKRNPPMHGDSPSKVPVVQYAFQYHNFIMFYSNVCSLAGVWWIGSPTQVVACTLSL